MPTLKLEEAKQHIYGTILSQKQNISGKLKASGPSAYEIAVKNGYEGTEEEWLESLVGPKGDKGDPGYTPVKGVDYFDGYSPIKGIDYFDGKNGQDGYTPIKGVDYFDGEDGERGPKGDTGPQGLSGADGYTPQKGVDYWTEADKQEIVDEFGAVALTGYATEDYVEQKVSDAKSYVDSSAADVKNDLLNGAGEAYDTLKELADLITENVDAIDALETVAFGKADAKHGHTIDDVSGLQSALDKKSASGHNHSADAITTGTLNIARFPTVAVAKGGTGATDAETARANLGVPSVEEMNEAFNALKTENWTFTLEDGSTVTKAVYVG